MSMMTGPIRLLQREISTITSVAWHLIPRHLKRRIAAEILRRRGDQESKMLADQLDRNNANVQQYEITHEN